MSTSQKYRLFISEPMKNKDAAKLAGIGPILGGRLAKEGFDKAYIVLGQFLLLKKDKELFVEWLKDVCRANKKQSDDCYNCLDTWCKNFL